MKDSKRLKSHRNNRRRRCLWCCSFSTPPLSPENPTESGSLSSKKTELPSNSPQNLPLARRILSPGRVSPIPDDPSIFHGTPKETTPQKPPTPAQEEGSDLGIFDVSLSLEGRNGDSLILELDSEILATNSSIFADLTAEYRKKLSGGLCMIEVPDLDNMNVFRETIELMLEVDIQKKLLKIGVLRAIDVVEVSAGINLGSKYFQNVPSSAGSTAETSNHIVLYTCSTRLLSSSLRIPISAWSRVMKSLLWFRERSELVRLFSYKNTGLAPVRASMLCRSLEKSSSRGCGCGSGSGSVFFTCPPRGGRKIFDWDPLPRVGIKKLGRGWGLLTSVSST